VHAFTITKRRIGGEQGFHSTNNSYKQNKAKTRGKKRLITKNIILSLALPFSISRFIIDQYVLTVHHAVQITENTQEEF